METTGGLAPYRIDAEIAHSSICTIYRAYEESLDRPVLIKKLHPQMAREEDIRKRFEREAQVCARVKHENIVDIYSYRADPDVTMLVMEFVLGESLGDLIKRQGRIEWKIALVMLAGVLKGLSHAHAKGVIHRDIKPDNLLVSEDGRIKITDFGLSTIADASKMTVQGGVVGTPAYLPPEQVTGGKSDHRGDLFSVGVTFYEALTGTSPFGGETFNETLKKILNYNVPPASAQLPEIPTEFDHILAHLLEKKPSSRVASADLALEEVRRLAQMKGVDLESSAVKDSLHNGANGSTPLSAIALTGTQPNPHHKPIAIWIVLFAALTLAVSLRLFPSGKQLLGDGLPEVTTHSLQKVMNRIGFVPAQNRSQDESLKNNELIKKNLGGDSKDIVVIKPQPSTPDDPRRESDVNKSSGPLLPGSLTITSRPWAMVTIDNVSYGQTPLAEPIELSPGEHIVTLINTEFPTPYMKKIELGSNSSVSIDVNLWDLVGVVQVRSVRPWAEIFVDDESFGLTPRAKPIILSFGKHVIEFRNPSYKIWRQELDIKAGNQSFDLNVKLEELPK